MTANRNSHLMLLDDRVLIANVVTACDRARPREVPLTESHVAFLPLWVIEETGPTRLLWDRSVRVAYSPLRPIVATWRTPDGRTGETLVGGGIAPSPDVVPVGEVPSVITGWQAAFNARLLTEAGHFLFKALMDDGLFAASRRIVEAEIASSGKRRVDVELETELFVIGDPTGPRSPSVARGIERLSAGLVPAAAGREAEWLSEFATKGLRARLERAR